ncbi:xylulokinase [Selenomonas sp. TAMA-11512]|uniref:xylulokinase n=1 Tax=Selenomonas sp. TAMA-11512 TaxID=3095337 RepID=UPI003091F100|nr:xylulokinase [Selenomonas sp. TAMA-11512]
MKSYIGLDLGTSSLKLLWADAAGEIKNECSKTYRYAVPETEYHEIAPSVWQKTLEEGLSELLAGGSPEERASVAAIGVTGQMHTTVFLDRDGESIRPAILWNDVRTRDMVAEVRKKIAETPTPAGIYGMISTGSPAMNLYWLKEEEPFHFERLAHFLIGPDYIVYALTGEISTDYCDASTSSLYDYSRERWSEEVRAVLGLSVNIYPPIRPSGVSAGTLLPAYREKYGLGAIPVTVGTGDNAAAALSMGILGTGRAALSLGTSGVLIFEREEADFEKKGKHIAFSISGEPPRMLVQGVLQSVGNTIDWWMKEILGGASFDEELSGFDASKLGEGRLLFYPYLMGDKTIYQAPGLRAAFIGLGAETRRRDMLISIFEGIAFGVKRLVEEMEVPKSKLLPLLVTGGGAKNPLWLEILANVLETEVRTGSSGDAVLGAVRLARCCVGEPLEVETKERGDRSLYAPCPVIAARYRQKYRLFKGLHDALRPY